MGALVSSAITQIGLWRERVARKRELLFTSAIDLCRVWVGRISSQSGANSIVPEITGLERIHRMLKEIFETGEFSTGSRKYLEGILDKAEDLSANKGSQPNH